MNRCHRVVLLALLAVCGAAQAQDADRRIAVTLDDLPWQRMGKTPAAQVPAFHAPPMASLQRANVPVVGFVAAHGDRIAPVTVDNGEWLWATKASASPWRVPRTGSVSSRPCSCVPVGSSSSV